MNWFFIALLAPALWSVTNHLDKYLINKYFHGLQTGALVLFSSLAGLFVLPFVLAFHPNVLNISLNNALLIMGVSAIALFQLFTYFYALKKDETSVVIPLFQTIPIFSYLLGYFILGETLTLKQMLAGLLIIMGAMAISLDLTDKKPRFKIVVFSIMLLSSFLIAFNALLFKFVAIQADFLTTAFWAYVGDSIIGLSILTFVKNYRQQFLSVFKRNKIPVISINVLNELINIIAVMCMRFATLLAPLALVWVVNGFQPFFVFVYGLILTLFFPNLGKESLAKKHVIQKVIAIFIMFIGTYLINN